MDRENYSKDLNTDETINIRAEIEKYLIHWKWFVLGVFLAIVSAHLYLRYTTPLFKASAVILIKDDKKSGGSAELAVFEDLGLGNTGQNIDNEIEIIKSRKIIGDVIKNLNLNISYFSKGRVIESELYHNSPLSIEFGKRNENFYKKDTIFFITNISESSFELLSSTEVSQGKFKFGDTISNGLGSFKLLKKSIKEKNSGTIKVVVSSLNKLIDAYKNKVNVSPVNKKSSVVTLSLQSPVKLKAEHFLDSLVSSYNKDAVYDKNLVSQKTKIFIDDRIELVKKDFNNINLDLKNFKTTNEVTNIEAESQLVLNSIDNIRTRIIDANIQLTLVSSLYAELESSESNNLLPSNLGLDDASIATSIYEYNKNIQAKNKLLRTASDLNPSVRSLNSRIEELKLSLIKSLRNSKKGIELTIVELDQEDKKIKAKISGIPVQELELGKIRLKQEITSGLYSYLLKKKEETDISLANTVANAKIIDKAYGNNIPVSPKKKIIYLAALLLGGVIPFVIIYLINLLDTKIHSKKELLNNISIPFIGSIPSSDSKERVVIKDDNRSSSAESFRLIRTNLDFILSNIKSKCKTIFVTSTTSGEGKSFTSINIASSLAISGKKVLLIGMDLRAPKVTEYLKVPEKKGVSNYILDKNLNIKDLIFQVDELPNLDILSSGLVPPNPAELLMSKDIKDLFESLKNEYDYIVVDTAPINLVTDTMLIAKYADMFVYVVRANYLDKRMLEIPQSLYTEKRLPNMAVVLNDVNIKRGYGYGFGYGYGYGYGAVEKPWYKKIFDRS